MMNIRDNTTNNPFIKSQPTPICNICLKSKKLTKDHAPQRSLQASKRVVITNLVDMFLPEELKSSTESKVAYSDDGLHFTSICERCNNRVLRRGDIQMKETAKEVFNYFPHLQSNIVFQITASIMTHDVLRSIFGHLIATRTDDYPSAFDEQVRSFVKKPDDPFPSGLYVYYWLYPYDQIAIIRDCVLPMLDRRYGEESCLVQVYYCRPLAFLISGNSRFDFAPRLNTTMGSGKKEEIKVPSEIRDWLWPLQPATSGGLLFGGSPSPIVFPASSDQE